MIIAPARVQGEGAAEEIVRGIQDLNSLSPPPDVIIVGRGGGSIEDLWCFNEEIVARAVRASRVPVISAVGHEIDFTICDFASDLRAPTPSAAAELVVGRVEEISDSISGALARITRAMSGRIKLDSSKLESLASHRVFGEPEYILGRYRQNIDILLHKMCAGMNDAVSDCRLRMESMRLRMVRRMSSVTGGCISRISRYRDAMSRLSENRISALNSRVEMANARLNAMNPRAVLARGYAMVSDTDGNVIDSTLKLRTGMKVRTEVSDGAFVSVVLPTGVSGRRVRPGAVKDDPGVNEKTPRQQSLFGFCDKNPD